MSVQKMHSFRPRLLIAAIVTLTLVLLGAALLLPKLVPAAASAGGSAAATVDQQHQRQSEGLPEEFETDLVSGDGSIDENAKPSVFDGDHAAVANLDAALLEAIRAAAVDAEADGVTFEVNSGWRSPQLQEALINDAVATYGSREEAAKWVAPSAKSSHVLGEAIDIGSLAATDWLAQFGSRYGLCQTYSNESWHYELRPEAPESGCPQPYVDPTHDPRLQ